MDLEKLDDRIRRFTPVHTSAVIACSNCGKPMSAGSGTTMCNDCIALTVDITEDVQKEGTITFCKNCNRLLIPPSNWIFAPRESRELLGAILKRLRGLSKLRLMDAKFLWTEPHSRRTKVKVTVQGEAEQFQNTLVQQSFVAEFYEASAQCPDCAKSFTANTWRATIQIRQKVEHKKTFFYLEQLILKNHAHKNTVSIQESREGLDFFYSQRNHALKMTSFLQSVVPVRMKKSEELISQDTHTGAKSYKFTYSIEIVPICKEDLLVLPKPLSRSLGIPSRLCLCYKIGNTVHLIDPVNLQSAELNPTVYWRHEFRPVLSSNSLTEFIVLDIEPAGPANNRFALADATIARSSDLGSNDTTYYVRTHLGGILHPGDTAMGYFLENSNINHALWEELDQSKVPEVVLVKKSYSDKPRKRNRNWKLKRMAKEHNDMQIEDSKPRGKQADAAERARREYEEFMRELEEDPELRQDVDLYLADNVPPEQDNNNDEGEDSDDDSVEIKLDELKIDDGESEELDEDDYEEPDEE
uniref:60S ribosomal export protein NMD3 n=1 Tax=Blastobotrys adeninivorans TaxID=409370 RepID=A0A060T5S4_BLAAD